MVHTGCGFIEKNSKKNQENPYFPSNLGKQHNGFPGFFPGFFSMMVVTRQLG